VYLERAQKVLRGVSGSESPYHVRFWLVLGVQEIEKASSVWCAFLGLSLPISARIYLCFLTTSSSAQHTFFDMYRLIIWSCGWLLTLLSSCTQSNTPSEQLPVAKQAADSNPVYTYVEQMPQLPQGGGQQAICLKILKRLHYPTFDSKEQLPESSIRVAFTVATDGTLQDAKLLASSHNASIDKALLDAVYTLPRLTPGYQNGRPVRVQLSFPITLEYQ
jgi:TonB family protein